MLEISIRPSHLNRTAIPTRPKDHEPTYCDKVATTRLEARRTKTERSCDEKDAGVNGQGAGHMSKKVAEASKDEQGSRLRFLSTSQGSVRPYIYTLFCIRHPDRTQCSTGSGRATFHRRS
uniref:Uncharacterized protein n=1 Tax=Physcomitrium patens TaxID=3218 RepID=A9RNB1_PHYPA|nr:hypothetical protein PHYPA_028533 [Physcomitrium patens]